MELNSKVQELEDELKILKAEIRNVLLDIREVILDRTNPLSEERESAFIRMDLNTTARALAAEAGGREAMKAAQAPEAPAAEKADEAEADSHPVEQPSSDASGATGGEDAPAADVPDQSPKGKARKGKGAKSAHGDSVAAGPSLEPAGIPPMFRATAGATSLASWVAEAVREIGLQQVDRIITIHRLCGSIPPNVSEALAHVQELIRSSDEEEPGWLGVLQSLESLA
jgi:hypothetical protein